MYIKAKCCPNWNVINGCTNIFLACNIYSERPYS